MSLRDAWKADQSLIAYVQQLNSSALAAYRENPNLIEEHANQEESIKVGGYAHRTVQELVQNASDALAGATASMMAGGRIEVVLDEVNRRLYVANCGRPFSREGLRAVVHAHLSAKRGDEIGRFGLGFKSVLAVTDHPQIFSRSVSFEFNAPEAQAVVSTVRPGNRKVPVLRTPSLLDVTAEMEADPVLAELGGWATTVVRLPEIDDTTSLRRDLLDFSTEFLLFVTAVRGIRIRIIGDEPIDNTHVSRDLGQDRFSIETPHGAANEWIVTETMHSPSATARREVGEAVSRDQMKVSVAIPASGAPGFKGRFWAYFPIEDETSASGLFNAPWSLNNDRTTLLDNLYNREILSTLLDLFLEKMPSLMTGDDPARHLDYLPSRPREAFSTADRYFRAIGPIRAAAVGLVPNAAGKLTTPDNLKPLDFNFERVDAKDHRSWQRAEHTGGDVPHWRCYTSPTRVNRLRHILAAPGIDVAADWSPSLEERVLSRMPKRGVLSWIREWAEGGTNTDTAHALDFVLRHENSVPLLRDAKVIPTNQGLVTLNDRTTVFLDSVEGFDVESATFVSSTFLEVPGVRVALERRGFRQLDAQTRLEAQMSRLRPTSVAEDHEAVWKIIREEVPPAQAVKAVERQGRMMKVPTLDGNWSWPQQVLHLGGIDAAVAAPHLLDIDRCVLPVARSLGVIDQPVSRFALSDEVGEAAYREFIEEHVNGSLGPGERVIDQIDLSLEEGPGPVSALILLRDSASDPGLINQWTTRLLVQPDGTWRAEDPDSRRTFDIPSPRDWAVAQAGLLKSDWGYRRLDQLVSRRLLRYQGLLPLYADEMRLEQQLGLASELSEVSADLFREALTRDRYAFSNTKELDVVLTEFLTAAARALADQGGLRRIPARIGRTVESAPVGSVYVAVDEEQVEYLLDKGKYFLSLPAECAEEFVEITSTKSFSEVYSFELHIGGKQDGEVITDVFTGFRNTYFLDSVRGAYLVRTQEIVKRVTTSAGEGVEPLPLQWHRDGETLYVKSDLDDTAILRCIADAFTLELTGKDLDEILQTGHDDMLEGLRREAQSMESDADRLEVYFTPEDLKEKLPSGLWETLEDQGLVDATTSVAELYLTVNGNDAVKNLRPLFRDLGYRDVPERWTRNSSTLNWLRKMGFNGDFASQPADNLPSSDVIPGAVNLPPLHDYQKKVRDELASAILAVSAEGHRTKAMVEMPTGAGKTRVASQTVLELFSRDLLTGPVLWIAESQELCEQAVQTWGYVWRGLLDERPLTVGRLWGSNRVEEPETDFSVIVATDAQLNAILSDPARATQFEWLRDCAVVVVDEAHRSGSSEVYTRLFRWLGVDGRNHEKPLVGLSATPFKGGDSGTTALIRRYGGYLIRAFESDSPFEEAAQAEVLARVSYRKMPGINVVLGQDEINDAKKFRRVNPKVLERIGRDRNRLRTLVHDIEQLDPDWPVLVFTPSVLSAQVLASTLRYKDISAASVSGETGRHERRKIIEDFKAGKIRVLANCDLLTQGFDAPGVRALYVARPTFSPSAYIQMVGRGLRGPKNGGKRECLIVDIEDNFGAENHLLGHLDYVDQWKALAR
ncbi:sacsin N-terminal ATP-binding-like domain-containing protein [Arthrobacter sp. VKM Ac-2550]|uniref:sacsin N-terminal ATP-binding-like domain-containing protein n=1 Tax=Crystallibacter permensis TaxID=1938888 RepID=UPI0022265A93|nr:DEAD/DEAH box helicase family protein [Arthrobacter sp. VKM Ac-2550]MCW2135108.1 Superfamily II DNA or RNA helicase [Arthrobacter sp. VKM Ac-2550]